MRRKIYIHTLEKFWDLYQKARRAQRRQAHQNSVQFFRINTINWLRTGAYC